MKVEQFYDKGLAHLSYAILSENEIALVDPARNPQPYYEWADNHNAKITAIIETHPHADFVSGHLEISKRTGAPIYIHSLAGPQYAHQAFDDGNDIHVGKIRLKALHTPGHSPDSISVVLEDEQGNDYAVFTGDTLFIGDVGRPDLRESAGNITARKEALARQMYHSLRNKLMLLPDHTIVYPAHGAGSLCGKSMSQELSGTILQQKLENYALQPMDEDSFVRILLEKQPAIPLYFPYDVELNRKGAPELATSLNAVPVLSSDQELLSSYLIIDTRPEFKSGHLPGAINIPDGGKFETWLGSIVSPSEKFYLIASNADMLHEVLYKAAKIGYELNITGVLAQTAFDMLKESTLDTEGFTNNLPDYTIIDVRDHSEVKAGKIFAESLHIPLPELRERYREIPLKKPIVVHCAGGYRSAIASSILRAALKHQVYDLGEKVKNF